MGKRKNDGKDIYRKKAFSGKFVRNLEKDYLAFIKEFKEIPKDPPKYILDFITDKFGVPEIEDKNPELKIIVFCKNEELKKILIDLGNRGANLSNIWKALEVPKIDDYLKDGHPIGLQLYEGELTPYWDSTIRNFKTKKRELLKRERVIKNAVRVIMELKPITLKHFYKDQIPWINGKLALAQGALKEVLDVYLDAKAIQDGLIGYPAKWGFSIRKLIREKFKPFTQRSHKIWNRRIVILVDELKGIGYSDRSAYLKTAELLNLAFPNLYRDKDPDLVRQRYSHQTTKK
jgi:hypothetical protein